MIVSKYSYIHKPTISCPLAWSKCVKTQKLQNVGLFSTCEDCHWRGLCLSLHGHLVEDLCLVILVIFIILVVTTNMIETFEWLAQ